MTVQRIKSDTFFFGGEWIEVDRTGQIIRSGLFNNPSKQVQPHGFGEIQSLAGWLGSLVNQTTNIQSIVFLCKRSGHDYTL